MNAFYLLIGMVFVVAVAMWAALRELKKPLKPTLEEEIRAKWSKYQEKLDAERLSVDEHIGKDANK